VRILTGKYKSWFDRVEDEYLLRDINLRAWEQSEKPKLEVPSLYIVDRKNPYVKMGQYVRRFTDGYEECIVDSPNGRLRIVGYTGPVWPHSVLGPFLMAIKRYGLDRGSERMDRRRMMEQVGG